MERLIVTGVDYPLGANLALALADRYRVLGLYEHAAVGRDRFATRGWQPACLPDARATLDDWRPDWIIHCPALSQSAWDVEAGAPIEGALESEPDMAVELAHLACDARARLTVVASDVVFAGPRMFHEETSPANSPAPRAALARQLEAALSGTSALVVRTHAFGLSPLGEHAGFAERSIWAIARGESVTAAGTRHATPILACDLAALLSRAYQAGLAGLFHLAGAERTSAYHFVEVLAKAFDARMPPIVAGAAAGWPEETSLSSKRARRQLEVSTPMLTDGLARFAAQAHFGWRDRWQQRAEAELAA